jgi:hypothetical protein
MSSGSSLLVPANVGKKRRNISHEIDMLWADENSNYQMRDFTTEEEAEFALLEDRKFVVTHISP